MKMDDLENQRNDKLIKEREEFEKEFFSRIVDEMIESEAFDKLISDRFEYIEEKFDFEPSPEYTQMEELYLKQYDSRDSSYDNDFDNLDGYDYPEGPDENLSGINYGEYVPNYDENFDFPEPDFKEDYVNQEPPEEKFYISDTYDKSYEYYSSLYEDLMKKAIENEENEKYESYIQSLIEQHENEKYESYIQSLIEQHEIEEKEFFDNLLVEALQEEHYFQRAIDEMIFKEIDIDYMQDRFDYDEDNYWYDEAYPADESVIDPFDSLDDYDYPDGPNENLSGVKYDEYVPYYDDLDYEIERDFEKFKRSEEIQETSPEEIIPEYPDELKEDIVEPSEENEFNKNEILRNEMLIKNQEAIEIEFKKYISKNDNLDKIIKEKLKEKKFKK